MSVELRFDDESLDRLAAAIAERIGVTAVHEDLVTPEEAARRLACRPQRLYNLKAEGRLPPDCWCKDGSRLLFRFSKLEQALLSNGES